MSQRPTGTFTPSVTPVTMGPVPQPRAAVASPAAAMGAVPGRRAGQSFAQPPVSQPSSLTSPRSEGSNLQGPGSAQGFRPPVGTAVRAVGSPQPAPSIGSRTVTTLNKQASSSSPVVPISQSHSASLLPGSQDRRSLDQDSVQSGSTPPISSSPLVGSSPQVSAAQSWEAIESLSFANQATAELSSVTADVQGLSQLIFRAKSWRAVLQLTDQLSASGLKRSSSSSSAASSASSSLTDGSSTAAPKEGPGETQYLPHIVLQLQLCRCISLVKLRQYKPAINLIQLLMNVEKEYHYQNFPQFYPAELKGSMFPFALRLLHAWSPAFDGDLQGSINQLYQLLRSCQKDIKHLLPPSSTPSSHSPSSSSSSYDQGSLSSDSSLYCLKLNPLLVEQDVLNCSLTVDSKDRPQLFPFKNSSDALPSIADPLLGKNLGPAGFFDAELKYATQPTLQVLLQRENMVEMQIANLFIQQKEYLLAITTLENILRRYPESLEIQSLIGRVYLQIGAVDTARQCFQAASNLFDRLKTTDNQMLLQRGKVVCETNKALLSIVLNLYEEAAGIFQKILDVDPSNHFAANNKAVCFLFLGKLAESIKSLEEICFHPTSPFLSETVVSNLCCLYDLHSDNPIEKKKAILRQIVQFAGDSFDLSVVKMPA